MPRESDLEKKVGLFVVTALVCLVAFIFSISDFSVFRGGAVYHAVFSYANGLKKNAPVRLAGVDAGHIRDLKVSFDHQTNKAVVTVEAWVAQGIEIPADSTFMVNQLGLLGEKYLEIMPGISSEMLSPETFVKGEDPIPMEAVTKQLSLIGSKVEATLKINEGMLTEENTKALSNTLVNIAAMTDKMNKGEGTVGRFLVDPRLYQNLEELSADLKANPWKLFYRSKGK